MAGPVSSPPWPARPATPRVAVRPSDRTCVTAPYQCATAPRLALSLAAIDSRVQEIRSEILQMLGLALLPTILVGVWLGRKVSRQLSQVIHYSQRLAQGNFQTKLPDLGGGEIGELADTLRTTGGQLRSMFEQLQEERSRFAAAVNGIGEGILVADRKLRTVLFNPAMEQMLPNTKLYKGAPLEEWERPEVPELFRKVLEERRRLLGGHPGARPRRALLEGLLRSDSQPQGQGPRRGRGVL